LGESFTPDVAEMSSNTWPAIAFVNGRLVELLNRPAAAITNSSTG
jgi:hypothetical protein